MYSSLIHGGAWRDPTQNASNFQEPAESILRTHPDYVSQTLSHIAGFASINYRLSSHPNYPQSLEDTELTEFRDARHPDHFHDVQAALALLQSKYEFGERYILIGHSCGATLSFQTVMGSLQASKDTPLPTAIVGTEGIYDLRLFRDAFKNVPVVQEFVQQAFGSNEALWDAVSPAKQEGPAGVEGGWKAGRLAVLAQSPDDVLVDGGQIEAMKRTLQRWEQSHTQETPRRVLVLPLTGEHDDPWLKGEGLAKAIAVTVKELQAMGLVSSS